MAEYRFLGYDLRTGALLGELPLAGVSYGRVLNGAGTLKAKLSLKHRNAAGTSLAPGYLAATDPQRTALYVERDGVLVWGGIIWGRNYDGEQLDIFAAEHWSYFHRRRHKVTAQFVAADQLDIARYLIEWAQAQPGGDIGVQSDTRTSLVLRDRTYYSYERGVIGTLVEQLSEVENGFDFGIDIAYVGDVPTPTLNLGYPRRGRIAGTTGLVFEPGRNLGNYQWNEDGTRGANSVDGIGAGEGAAMLIATAGRPDLVTAGYPLLEDVVAHKDVRYADTLDGHARAAVNARALPIVSVVLVDVKMSADPPFGSWIMGDDCLFRVEDDDRFPAQADGSPGLSRYVRIIADDVKVADEGVETVTITCGEITSG